MKVEVQIDNNLEENKVIIQAKEMNEEIKINKALKEKNSKKEE